MNLVDSCGWLEFFADGPNAEDFSEPLANPQELIVPSITLFEVFKVVLRERGEGEALQAVALMRQGRIIVLSDSIAIYAGKVGHERKLPMADSIVYATALLEEALVWTQDSHFKNLPQVKYFPKK